jgi:hypothetical protein
MLLLLAPAAQGQLRADLTLVSESVPNFQMDGRVQTRGRMEGPSRRRRRQRQKSHSLPVERTPFGYAQRARFCHPDLHEEEVRTRGTLNVPLSRNRASMLGFGCASRPASSSSVRTGERSGGGRGCLADASPGRIVRLHIGRGTVEFLRANTWDVECSLFRKSWRRIRPRRVRGAWWQPRPDGLGCCSALTEGEQECDAGLDRRPHRCNKGASYGAPISGALSGKSSSAVQSGATPACEQQAERPGPTPRERRPARAPVQCEGTTPTAELRTNRTEYVLCVCCRPGFFRLDAGAEDMRLACRPSRHEALLLDDG